MSSKLIIALDFEQAGQALALIDQLDPAHAAVKIGSELFTRAGPAFVQSVISRGYRVFLDLKFHDIPHTVAQACKAAADLGVWMLSLHASGGTSMMQAASAAMVDYGSQRPYLIAVTVLTSMGKHDLAALGVSSSLPSHVEHLAQLAQAAGMDGVVSSAEEVARLKACCGQSFLVVTPGIRMPGEAADDQVRVITPQVAIAAGTDYLVMGRSITRAADPVAVVNELMRYVSV